MKFFKEKPGDGVKYHGDWNIVSNKMMAEQLHQFTIFDIIIFKNHFRIIPTNMAKH